MINEREGLSREEALAPEWGSINVAANGRHYRKHSQPRRIS